MIKTVDSGDLPRALELVNRVFAEFVAVDYPEEGKKTFADYLENKLEEVAADVESGRKKIWGYYENDEIIGVIATREISHIALMFVDKNHHRKGVARQLFNTVLDDVRQNSGAEKITVNSSPYAVGIYEKLGFVKTDEQQMKDGILYTPMMREICM